MFQWVNQILGIFHKNNEIKTKNRSKRSVSGTVDHINIDEMLSYAGDFHRYQIILIALFCFINVLSALHYFGQTFTTLEPVYKSNQSNQSQNYTRKCPPRPQNSSEPDPLFGYTSIVEQLDWCGEDDWKSSFGQSIFFIGSVIGTLILGILADRIGRLHVLILANFLAFVGNIITWFSREIYSFSMSRFIAGLATDTNFCMMYIIVMEYLRPSLRTAGLNLCIGFFYCFACVSIPWIAIYVGNWKNFMLVVSIPHLLVLGFYFIIPESAQWLISKGRIDSAIQCFKRIAKTNKKELEHWQINGLKNYCSENIIPESKSTLIDLFRTPKLRKKTIILIFKSMVMTLCYDAISKNVNDLGYSPFTLFSITSITILPACLIITWLQDRIGRKAMASVSFLISGLFTSISGYILATLDNPDYTLTIGLAFIARLSINIAYNSGAQYAVELIPTEVRGQGVSAIHVCGYAASFFSTHILYLRKYWPAFPEVVLGALLMMGALTCLMLPETLNKTLPVSIKDGEEFGEDEKIWEFACCSRKTDSEIGLNT